MLQIFTQIDELENLEELEGCTIMFIFTTNRLRDLDPAFKRTGGRNDVLITVDLPSKEELEDALDESLVRHGINKEKSPDWLVNKMATEKFSYGDTEFLLDEVRELVKEYNHKSGATNQDYKEAMEVTITRKKKVEELSEEEERRNAEWKEKNFQER